MRSPSRAARTRSRGDRRATRPVGSYVMRLTVEADGGRRVYGGRRPATPDRANAPVVRVLGIEAAFTQRSYLPKDRMSLRVLADTPSFTLTFLRVGHGPDPSQRSDEMTGLPMARPDHDRLDREALARPGRSSCSRATGRVGSTRRSSRPPTAASASRPSSSAPPSPARVAWRSSCRRTRGRRTTSTTPTATAGATPGTPAGRRRSCSTGRTATGASRRGSSATTSRSSAGSRRRVASPTSTPTTTSTPSRAATTCGRRTTSSSSPATAST